MKEKEKAQLNCPEMLKQQVQEEDQESHKSQIIKGLKKFKKKLKKYGNIYPNNGTYFKNFTFT